MQVETPSADGEVRAYNCFLEQYEQAENGQRAHQRGRRGRDCRMLSQDDIQGRSVLIIGENGIGDKILTLGCLPDIVKVARTVAWRCDPKLKTLLSRGFPTVSFLSEQDNGPNVDCVVFSWELIGLFRRQLSDFPKPFRPWLTPCGVQRDKLRKRYGADKSKIVGLAWRSERNGEPLSNKTCDLLGENGWGAFFSSLSDKARFISLQYGDTAEEINFARRKYGVEILQDRDIDILGDIAAAAAQVAAMDHVVTISTTAAHLAGAMAISGWVMLPKTPFLHWRAGTENCPWYPSLRLARQCQDGQWQCVVEGAAAGLAEALASR